MGFEDKIKRKKLRGFLGKIPEEWEKEWKGMPEWNQGDFAPFKSVIVHLRDQEALDSLSKFTGQRIMPKTRFVWYPRVEILHQGVVVEERGKRRFGEDDES